MQGEGMLCVSPGTRDDDGAVGSATGGDAGGVGGVPLPDLQYSAYLTAASTAVGGRVLGRRGLDQWP